MRKLHSLLGNLDPLTMSAAWNLSLKAVRPRLNGERDLTLSEISIVADLVGIDVLLDALSRPLEQLAKG